MLFRIEPTTPAVFDFIHLTLYKDKSNGRSEQLHELLNSQDINKALDSFRRKFTVSTLDVYSTEGSIDKWNNVYGISLLRQKEPAGEKLRL